MGRALAEILHAEEKKVGSDRNPRRQVIRTGAIILEDLTSPVAPALVSYVSTSPYSYYRTVIR